MERDDKVICISDFENHWGGCTQVKGNLIIGQEYTIEAVEVHSWHTKIWLKEISGKYFNHIHFENVS